MYLIGRNEKWCAKDNHIYMRHIRAKRFLDFLDSHIGKTVTDKI